MPERSHPWYDIGWPLFAGLVAAVGIIACYESVGLLGCVAAFALIEVAVGATAWAILTDIGRSGQRALFEVGPACGLTTVVAVGLTEVFASWGLLVLLLVIATSPLLHSRRPRVTRYGGERAAMRRQFDEIVAHGFAEDESY
jgi:hypothetical protein